MSVALLRRNAAFGLGNATTNCSGLLYIAEVRSRFAGEGTVEAFVDTLSSLHFKLISQGLNDL